MMLSLGVEAVLPGGEWELARLAEDAKDSVLSDGFG